jgi:hypothetical protein
MESAHLTSAWRHLSEAEPRLADALVGRVERGARLLDRLEPGWHLRIAADRLAMETCNRCILGQLHGEFAVGFRNVLASVPGRRDFSAFDHGFALGDEDQQMSDAEAKLLFEVFPARIMARFEALAELWRVQVWGRAEGIGPGLD